MLTLNNKNYLCIVDYQSKFQVVKKAEDLPTVSLILACNIIFSKYGFPKKVISEQVVILFQMNLSNSANT